jgi:hypothetical protein
MDAASAAAMSDPDRNPHFRRRWQEPPAKTTLDPPRPPAGALGPVGHALLDAWCRQQPQRDGGGRER